MNPQASLAGSTGLPGDGDRAKSVTVDKCLKVRAGIAALFIQQQRVAKSADVQVCLEIVGNFRL